MEIKKSHKKIYDAFKKRPMGKYELVDITGLSYDGIRGRISEMRKLGFDIQLLEMTEKKYVLLSDITTSKKHKFLEHLKKKALFDKPIDINGIAKTIGITPNDIIDIISGLFKDKDYSIVQLSNTQIKVKKNIN
jgi:hypothetical protein